MKKLLGILVLGLLVCSNAYAKVINPHNLDMKGYWEQRNGIKFPNKSFLGKFKIKILMFINFNL